MTEWLNTQPSNRWQQCDDVIRKEMEKRCRLRVVVMSLWFQNDVICDLSFSHQLISRFSFAVFQCLFWLLTPKTTLWWIYGGNISLNIKLIFFVDTVGGHPHKNTQKHTKTKIDNGLNNNTIAANPNRLSRSYSSTSRAPIHIHLTVRIIPSLCLSWQNPNVT